MAIPIGPKCGRCETYMRWLGAGGWICDRCHLEIPRRPAYIAVKEAENE